MPKNLLNIYGYFQKNRIVVWIPVILSFFIALYYSKQVIIDHDISKAYFILSIIMLVILLIIFGRIELTLISLVPFFVTSIFLAGIAGFFKIQFDLNPSIVSGLVLSLVTAQGIFILQGQLKHYKTGKKGVSSYRSLVFILTITAVACLLLQILAHYPEIKSLTILVTLGGICVAFLPRLFIAPLFNFLITSRVQKNRFPWTFFGLSKSAFAFAYFVAASLVLTLLGLIFVKLNPFSKEKGKLLYHVCVSKFCWSLMYIMGNVKKKIINPDGEDFSRPAVIICNHQSFLDILSTVMLSPKLILFTNHWVWNSPVFGFVVRMADYYPVMQGADGSIDLVADRVRQGYCVVVFPEGTRSADGNINRFHKGAFFLAEKLGLDILPILIHGSGYTMGKGDFLLKDGTITLQLLPRIKPTELSFGTGYTERAKLISKYFRTRFNQLRQELEQPSYFKEQLIYNYIYKGPVLEWYLRIKLHFEKNYALFDDLLPRKGKLLDAGCGYGFLTYMLHFISSQREITGVDYDETKIETANYCLSKTEKMSFIHADILVFSFEKYDGIILSDVLHYLPPLQQKQVVEKCMQSLNENGILIIRDGNKDLTDRHRGTQITEFFSTTFSGFNKTTKSGLSFFSGSLIREIAAEQKMGCTEIDQSKYTSNVIFVIKKIPVVFHAAV
ncbi:MAG TPA: 1-acyl-sn-glycerol-3-phosphate acyltransferase [Puia sp.]|nr:1-acyl-sn-glycerol-3-phosphate acyltransferase [Puia sp.]